MEVILERNKITVTIVLWSYANGLDTSRVMPGEFEFPVKSIGLGITCNADLDNNEEVWKIMLSRFV